MYCSGASKSWTSWSKPPRRAWVALEDDRFALEYWSRLAHAHHRWRQMAVLAATICCIVKALHEEYYADTDDIQPDPKRLRGGGNAGDAEPNLYG
jgi:hypothetical protein